MKRAVASLVLLSLLACGGHTTSATRIVVALDSDHRRLDPAGDQIVDVVDLRLQQARACPAAGTDAQITFAAGGVAKAVDEILAGANGLGKSTFVAAINFALTGRVADPERTFGSTGEYYSFTEDFSKRFFDGRVSGRDRATAEVEVVFTRSLQKPAVKPASGSSFESRSVMQQVFLNRLVGAHR